MTKIKKIKKKMSLLVFSSVIVLGMWLAWDLIKDDERLIEQEVHSLHQLYTELIHIELINNEYSLAFYEWGNLEHIGVVELEKTLFGWRFSSSMSERVGQDAFYVELNHFSVISQAVPSTVDEVYIELPNGNIHNAKLIEGEELINKYWIYYSDTEILSQAIVTTYDKNGDKLSEVKMPDEPNEGLDRTVE
ncbi:hypothetical protein HXA31_18025 [Salipaludibacillus agaradhaerens]|uniref:Uncharacterized protein n=1 Tax=Salipaludibacillus agaradhaerens TaxID=76935 RepID=A0A9Q4B4S2_SALAG|nr:hypothetical protein [Salipaludibacillus agaradhaerens]MCR6098135.1 hypothetical protein [Salipaludibacillus agaradhaerens]MCR6116235.1 hypothetical protein [Salipaludibacillus agaradhaerens]